MVRAKPIHSIDLHIERFLQTITDLGYGTYIFSKWMEI